jgi:hypothetical protein
MRILIIVGILLGLSVRFWHLQQLPKRNADRVTAKGELLLYLTESNVLTLRMRYLSCGSASKEDVRASTDVRLSESYFVVCDELGLDKRKIYVGTIANSIFKEPNHSFVGRLSRLGLRRDSLRDKDCADWIAALSTPEVGFLTRPLSILNYSDLRLATTSKNHSGKKPSNKIPVR